MRFSFFQKVLEGSVHHYVGEWKQSEGSLQLPSFPLYRAAEPDHFHLLPPLHHQAL